MVQNPINTKEIKEWQQNISRIGKNLDKSCDPCKANNVQDEKISLGKVAKIFTKDSILDSIFCPLLLNPCILSFYKNNPST